MATTADFRNGLCLEFNNDLYSIVQFQHVKPGKGPAFVRTKMKSLIHDIHQYETEADFLEQELKRRIFSEIKDALVVFHMVRLIELVGNIADHAENASDRMRAMIAR